MSPKKKKKKSGSPERAEATPDVAQEQTPPAEAPPTDELETAALDASVAETEAPGDEAPGDGPAPAEEPLRDQLLRLQADFDNFRRRTQRERSELYQRANEDLIGDLLSVLDHFELGFKNAADHEANPDVVAGFRMVFDQALTTLAKFGLQPVDAVGEPFDPHLHEAITQMPSDEVAVDIVVAQTRRGYRLADRLLRAAQVVVSAGPGPQEPPVDQDPAQAAHTAVVEDEA